MPGQRYSNLRAIRSASSVADPSQDASVTVRSAQNEANRQTESDIENNAQPADPYYRDSPLDGLGNGANAFLLEEGLVDSPDGWPFPYSFLGNGLLNFGLLAPVDGIEINADADTDNNQRLDDQRIVDPLSVVDVSVDEADENLADYRSNEVGEESDGGEAGAAESSGDTDVPAENLEAEAEAEAEADVEVVGEDGSTDEVAGDLQSDGVTEAGAAPATDGATEADDAEAALRAWRAGVRASSAGMPEPGLGEAMNGGERVQLAGSAMTAARGPARRAVAGQARAAVSAPPEVEDAPPPPPPGPVPAANRLVESKSDLLLIKQKMPDLKPSPRGTQPRRGDRPLPEQTESSAATGSAGAVESQEEGAQENTDREHAEQVRESAREVAPEEEREATSEGVELVDELPPPPPPLPAAAKTVISDVLARLLANPEKPAEQFITDARKAAYRDETLENEYPDIGKSQLDSIAESLTSKLHGVAEEAGIARDDIDAAVARRHVELRGDQVTAEQNLRGGSAAAQAELETSGQEETDAVAGARQQVDEHTQQQYEAAGGQGDPEIVNRNRDEQQQRLNRKVGRQRAAYSQAKDRRVAQIRGAAGAQAQAYRAAVQTDERAIRNEHKDEDVLPLSARWNIAGAHTWGATQEREVGVTVREMTRAAEANATQYRDDVSQAGVDAHQMIEDWANEQLGHQQSWWEKLLASFSSWFTQAQAESEAWEEVRAGETRDSILGNYVFLNQFAAREGENVNLESNEAFKRLSEEQQAVVRAYYAEGPEARNPLTGVVAGLKVRMSHQLRPGLLEKFESELAEKPANEWEKLEALGKSQSEGFSADRLRSELRAAMFGGVTGWGTDEDRIFAALNGLTPVQGIALRKCYSASHGGANLDSDLESELGGAEHTRAAAQLAGNQSLADAATLNEAMHGGITGWGTDEDVIMRTLRGKSEEERAAIIEAYQREYGVDLSVELDDELSDHDWDRADALMDGNTALADAIAIDQAMRGGWTGAGTDESAIEAVYADVRRDVAAEAQRRGWNTAQMEAEIRRRNAGIEGSYQERYGDDWEPGDESALRQAYRSDLSGSELDLVVALADNDLIAADAARLDIESRSFMPDADVSNGVLRHQYERAYEELKRDEWPAMQRELDRQARENGWDRYQRRDAERRMERQLEARAQNRSRGYMEELEGTFNREYTRWTGAGLSDVLTLTMGSDDRKEARDLMAQGGRLTPAQEIHYAVTGVGTEEQAIQRVLAGRSPEEIALIRAEWNKLHPNQTLDDRLESELGGRDEFDTRLLMRGEPRNARVEMARMRERADWEFENSSGFLADEQEAILRDRIERMEASYAALNDPDATPAERAQAARRFHQRSGNVKHAVSAYREQMDATTDVLATAAAVAAAIVVVIIAAVLTPFTGGGSAAAGAGILAALGGALTSGTVAAAAAVAAATATIVTKQVMLGDAYSGEDMAIDAVVGVVDAVTAYATAGIGTGLLKAARGGALARMAVNPSRMTRFAAHGLAEGAEGLISSLPAAVASNVANDKNWENGNPLANIMTGIAIEAGIGTVVSAGMGGISGLRNVPSPDARPQGDLLAHRGTPRERLAQWKAYKAEHPDADMRTWLREFDDGVAQRLARGDAANQMQRKLRGELLSGMPVSQRRRFADATVEVLSDADFTRRTGHARAQAATIVEGGKARVLLREGADPRVLREEGIHLLQSVDPRTRRAVRSLDESKLAKWDDLSIDDQMRLYRNKIDLEIDAQGRLMRSLDEDLTGSASDSAARRALLAQRDLAEQNLRNLRNRLGEVEGIGPKQRKSIAQGLEEKPRFLSREPPRLFSKGEVGDTRIALLESIGSAKQVEKARKTLRLMGERVKDQDSIRATYHRVIEVAERLSRTDPLAARKYLDSVHDVLTASPGRANTKRVVAFIDKAATMADPHLFLRNVSDVVADTRIRGDQLQVFGEEIAGMTRRDAADFVSRLRRITRIDPSNTTAIENAFEGLKRFARSRRGIRLGFVDEISDEVTRDVRFDWNAFRSKLGVEHSGPTGFVELESILTKRASAGWGAADIGPVRHWAEALQTLHRELADAAKRRELMDAVDNLLADFDSGYSPGKYRKFRHLVRNRVLDHVMNATPARARSSTSQMSELRKFLDKFQDLDSASKGSLFTEYRRRLLDRGGVKAGEFSNVDNIPGASLKLPNGKTADGAVRVGSNMGTGKPQRGRYLVDDKAGLEAFDLDQAQRYSDLLDVNNLVTADGRSRGLIYVFESPAAAESARKLLNAKGMNRNIFVATFDKSTGRLKVRRR